MIEDTQDLKDLQSTTQLSVQEMNQIIISHFNRFNFNIAVTYQSRVLIKSEYVKPIVEYYQELSEMIWDIEIIRGSKSKWVPFENGSYVYFLLSNDEVVYVGQTVNLCGRLCGHVKDKVFDYVYYTNVSPENRLIFESMNINYYQPRYNQVSLTRQEIFGQCLRKLFM